MLFGMWVGLRSEPSGLFFVSPFLFFKRKLSNLTRFTEPPRRLWVSWWRTSHAWLLPFYTWLNLFLFSHLPLWFEKEDECGRTRHGRSVPGEEAGQESSRSSRFVLHLSFPHSFDRIRLLVLVSGFLSGGSLNTITCSIWFIIRIMGLIFYQMESNLFLVLALPMCVLLQFCVGMYDLSCTRVSFFPPENLKFHGSTIREMVEI